MPGIRQIIDTDDFYREAHRLIFSAMVGLHDKKIGIDFVTLKNELAENYEKTGGDQYITSLIDVASTSAGWKAHTEIIRKKSDQRRIIELCGQVAEFSHQYDPEEALSQLKDGIRGIERESLSEIEDIHHLYTRVYEQIYQKREPGLYTGIECLRDKLYFEPGYIHTIAAESGVGKSALLLQIADYISRVYGPCLFYSMESTRDRLGLRQIARYSRVALTRINKSHFEAGQDEKIMAAVSDLTESSLILIDDIRFQEVERLCAHAESYALRHNLSAIFIDFLQLLSSKKKHNSRHLEISYIITQFKALAKDLNLPVIFACQLRKDIKGRPTLDDLKESGDIRTHTDNILFLYAPNNEKTVYPVEIFLAKGKEQERFSRWFEFNGNYQRFTEGQKPEPVQKKRGYDGKGVNDAIP